MIKPPVLHTEDDSSVVFTTSPNDPSTARVALLEDPLDLLCTTEESQKITAELYDKYERGLERAVST
jgi:hypothetical protein